MNLSGDSGVTDYEVSVHFVRVRFRNGVVYRYSYATPGPYHVDRMKALAIAGRGLGTYISQNVRDAYESKE